MPGALRYILASLLLAACAGRPAEPPPPPAYLLGTFTDDYDERYEITLQEWVQLPHGRFHIVRWDVAGQYLIAHNDPGNPSDGDLWSRIDWIELPGMPPYTWAYCYSSYQAPSAAVAETVSVANRAVPRTGCNGFPFSRMRPAGADSGPASSP